MRYGRIGGQRERVRGEYRGRYLPSKKKKGKFASSFTSPEKAFFFIYEVIVKQKVKNGPLITTNDHGIATV